MDYDYRSADDGGMGGGMDPTMFTGGRAPQRPQFGGRAPQYRSAPPPDLPPSPHPNPTLPPDFPPPPNPIWPTPRPGGQPIRPPRPFPGQ